MTQKLGDFVPMWVGESGGDCRRAGAHGVRNNLPRSGCVGVWGAWVIYESVDDRR